MASSTGHHYESQTSEYGDVYHSIASPPDGVPTPPRKSHDRQRSPTHIPRPPNAFLLYRSDFLKKGIIPADVESKQQNISVVVGECWKRLTSDEQQVWKDLAKQKEKEHAMKYPDYQYKPVKRGPIQRRRKMMNREEELYHCDALRTKYLPDKTGPVIQPGSRKPRERKSHVNPRRSTRNKDTPSTEPRVSTSLDGPIFLDPLLLPPSPPCFSQPPTPQWSNQSSPKMCASQALLDPDLEPPVFYDNPTISLEDDLRDWAPRHSPSLLNDSREMGAQSHMSAVAHIRQKFDNARRGGHFPTFSTDALEAQAIFERQSFFAAPRPRQNKPASSSGYPAPPEAEDPGSSRSDYSHGFALQQPDLISLSLDTASLFPPAFVPNQPDPSLPNRSAPQYFPMTLEAPEPFEPLRLQPPVFSPYDTPRHNLDSLTISFDGSSLARLSGNFGPDDQSELFGEASGFDLGRRSRPGSEWSEEDIGDILQVDVCSKED